MMEESLNSLLKSLGRSIVTSILTQIPGVKDLIIDPDVLPLLDMICGVTQLKETGVDKIFKLEPGSSTPGEQFSRCFLVRSQVSSIRTIIDLINADGTLEEKGQRQYYILSIPRLTTICDNLLEEGGVYGKVTIIPCPVSFFPLDKDVFSLERRDFFYDLFLQQDKTCLFDVAQSVFQVQQLLGPIHRMVSLGPLSKDVLKQVDIMDRADKMNPMTGSPSEEGDDPNEEFAITDLLILDRDMDYVSILLSQTNYEGILDEVFNIECGKIFIPPGIVKPHGVKHSITSMDTIYAEIRDLHFVGAIDILPNRSLFLKQRYEALTKMNLSQVKEFVDTELSNLQRLKDTLNVHISISHDIKQKRERFSKRLAIEGCMVEGDGHKEVTSFLDTLIMSQESACCALRLMSLWCVTQEGIPIKQWKHLAKLFVHSFGHSHILTLSNLKRLRLFYDNSAASLLQSAASMANELPRSFSKVTTSTSSSPVSPAMTYKFKEMARTMNLIPSLPPGAVYDNKNPPDAAFVYGGAYIPLVHHIVHCMHMSESGTSAESIFTTEVRKVLPNDVSVHIGKHVTSKTTFDSTTTSSKKVMAIYFVGGITYAEMSALRFWSKRTDVPIVIFTTGIINGNRLMKDVMAIKS